MIDIMSYSETTEDLTVLSSAIKKAENLLSVQLESLEYAQDFGVDLDYFLSSEFSFQNTAFKSYLQQRLAENNIDVTGVVELVERFYNQYTFSLNDVPSNDSLMG